MTDPSAQALAAELSHLQRLARALVADAALADDAVQDTLLVSLQRPPRGVRDLRAWLGTVLRHRLRRLGRREANRAVAQARAAARDGFAPAAVDVVATATLHQQLGAEVAALPEPYRTAVVLRYLHDLAVAEVAHRTAVPKETARARLKRGLALLRERLDARHGGRSWSAALVLPARRAAGLPALAAIAMVALVGVGALALVAASTASRPRQDASAESSVPATVAAPAEAVRSPSRVEIVAAPRGRAGEVYGKVVRFDGQLICGATVTLLREPADDYDGLPALSAAPQRLATQVAVDGEFRFTAAAGRLYRVQVRAPDFVPTTRRECLAGSELRVELASAPGAARDSQGAASPRTGRRLAGRVREAATARPVVGARVSSDARPSHVHTDASGGFVLDDLPARDVCVQVIASGFAPHRQRLDDGEASAELDVALGLEAVVVGVLRDPAGHPVAGAQVALAHDPQTSPAHPFAEITACDSTPDGRFRVTGLVPGVAYQLMVMAQSFGTRVYNLARPLLPGETLDLGDLRLASGAGLAGVVVDAAGRPVEGVSVRVYRNAAPELLAAQAGVAQGGARAEREHYPFVPTARQTLHDGKFAFADLAAGDVELVIRWPGARRAEFAQVCALRAGEVTDVGACRLELGGAIIGRLQRPAGVDAGAQIVLQAFGRESAQASVASVDGEGRFVFVGLQPGTHHVTALIVPSGWSLVPRLDVPCGGEPLELRLVPSATIDGRVLDEQGQPVADAVVAAESTPLIRARTLTVRTAADGRFVVEVEPGFVGRLQASHGGRRAALAVVAGAREIELRLR